MSAEGIISAVYDRANNALRISGSGGADAALAGDVIGTALNSTVVLIQNTTPGTAAFANLNDDETSSNTVTVWTSRAAKAYVDGHAAVGDPAVGGDLTGTASTARVAKINGTTVGTAVYSNATDFDVSGAADAAVAALPLLAAGTYLKVTDNGAGTFVWDLNWVPGSIATQAASAVNITGGAISGLSSLGLNASAYAATATQGITGTRGLVAKWQYTQTADNVWTAGGLNNGTAVLSYWDTDVTYAGANPSFGPYIQTNDGSGARADFQVEGEIRMATSTHAGRHIHVGFQNMLRITHTAGFTGSATWEVGYPWVNVQGHIANGAGINITIANPDSSDGPVAFYEGGSFAGVNGATMTAAGNYTSFLSSPALGGSGLHFGGRVGFDVRDVNIVGAFGSGNGLVDVQYGVRIARLASATTNYGIYSEAPYAVFPGFWNFTAAPPLAPFDMTSLMTFDFASGIFGSVFDIHPTLNIKQATAAFNFFSAFTAGPTIKNDPSVANGTTLISANSLFQAGGNIQFDTATGLVYTTIRQWVANANVNRINGATGGTVTNLEDFVSTPTVSTGTTVTNRVGFHVSTIGGTGTVTNNYGVYIDALTRGSTLNVGVYSNAPIWTIGTPFSVYAAAGDAQPAVYLGQVSTVPGVYLGPGGSTGVDVNFRRTGSAAAAILGQLTIDTGLTVTDAKDIVIGTSTGTKIGQSSSKIAVFGATPVVQQSNTTDLRTGLINFGIFASGGANPLDLNGGAFTAATVAAKSGTGVVALYANTTDTQPLVQLYNAFSGAIQFGPGGSTAPDVSLARTGAAAASFTGQLTIATGITYANAVNIAFNTTTGTKIGTATSQKMAFWNATPIIQPASANQAAVGTTAPAGGTGVAAGGWSSAANRDTAISTINSCVTLVNQLRSDLVAAGVIKGSA